VTRTGRVRWYIAAATTQLYFDTSGTPCQFQIAADVSLSRIKATTTTTMMCDCITPPDVVLSGCRCSRPSELDLTSTPRRPPLGTHTIRDDQAPDFMVTSPLTSLFQLTSSTPESGGVKSRPRTVSRRVDFLLNETSDESLPTPARGPDVTSDCGGSPVRRPRELDVEQSPSEWNAARPPQTSTSMIVIGEEDVGELCQPVNINGNSFALLQTPVRLFYFLNLVPSQIYM